MRSKCTHVLINADMDGAIILCNHVCIKYDPTRLDENGIPLPPRCKLHNPVFKQLRKQYHKNYYHSETGKQKVQSAQRRYYEKKKNNEVNIQVVEQIQPNVQV